METIIKSLDGKPIVMEMADFDERFNADDMTRIQYENLYGDAVTVSALLNKIGALRAVAENELSHKDLSAKIYEATLRKDLRREGAENGGRIKIQNESVKLTEKSLDEAVILDKAWQIKQKNVFKSQEVFSKVDSFYWSVQSKDKKLNNLIAGLTEAELWDTLVDGKVNGILIKKRKSITDRINVNRK